MAGEDEEVNTPARRRARTSWSVRAAAVVTSRALNATSPVASGALVPNENPARSPKTAPVREELGDCVTAPNVRVLRPDQRGDSGRRPVYTTVRKGRSTAPLKSCSAIATKASSSSRRSGSGRSLTLIIDA